MTEFEAAETAGDGPGRRRRRGVRGALAWRAQTEGGSEKVGLVVAVIVLLVAFGSVIAMGIPDRHRAVRHVHRLGRSSASWPA